jgi:hypothetical protein
MEIGEWKSINLDDAAYLVPNMPVLVFLQTKLFRV